MKIIEMVNLLITILSQNRNIKRCSYQEGLYLNSSKNLDGVITIEYSNDNKVDIGIEFLEMGYPKNIEDKCKQLKSMNSNWYWIILSSAISEKSASICRKYNIGYLDAAGNCLISFDDIYIHILGKKNNNLPKQRKINSIYERSSVVSSKILRLLFSDIRKRWKLYEIANTVQCSIGQVSKVKSFLLDNVQINQSKEGIQIIEPIEILKQWAKTYGKRENEIIECYSFDDVSIIEDKLAKMKKEIGVDYYLTGFSGGARYQPVVRYHKVHCYIMPKDIEKAINYLGCKKVSGGSNIDFIIPYDKCILEQCKEVNESMVVSPVQLYLDCMNLKNRGEELAEAILMKEII